MSTDTLLDAATELAYLVRHEPSATVAAAIRDGIRPEDKNALIVLLAALIDIDKTRTELAATLRAAPTVMTALHQLQQARVVSYRPQYEAWQHGDRDPEVVNHARQYAAHSGAA